MRKSLCRLTCTLALLTLPLSAPAADEGHAAAYDQLLASYGPFVSQTDPTGWAMKVQSVASDPYKFWRGTKDLFFRWSIDTCSDWYADRASYVPSHGDLHLGNIGAYFAGDWGNLAFGMVDFDDGAELPYQLELLSGVITLELIAQTNGIALDDSSRAVLTRSLIDEYMRSIQSDQNATQRLAEHPAVTKLLRKAGREYAPSLREFTEGQRIVKVIRTGKGEVKDLFLPANDRKRDIARALNEARLRDDGMLRSTRYRTVQQWEGAIKWVALRTRLGSSGSQGLEKIFVLVERPFPGRDHDGVFYFKQQIAPAAERAGAIPSDWTTRSPGERTVHLMRQMTDPVPAICSWADIAGKSYWISLREPWSDELEFDNIKTYEQLLDAARLWAIVAGGANRGFSPTALRSERARDQLARQIGDRASRYLEHLNRDYKQYIADPRVIELSQQARDYMANIKD